MDVMNSVTPKAAAKHDLLFNEPASGVWPFYFKMRGISFHLLAVNASRSNIY
jgi:hypothetical protein